MAQANMLIYHIVKKRSNLLSFDTGQRIITILASYKKSSFLASFLGKMEKMLKLIDKYRKRNKMESKFRSTHVFIHNITHK